MVALWRRFPAAPHRVGPLTNVELEEEEEALDLFDTGGGGFGGGGGIKHARSAALNGGTHQWSPVRMPGGALAPKGEVAWALQVA